MVELTMGGAWFRWSSLDAPSKWLFGTSFAAICLAGAPVFRSSGDIGYRANSAEGSEGLLASDLSGLPGWAAWWFIGCCLVSAVLWRRFSLRQDELFNRVQNWSFAVSSVAFVALLGVWSMLDAADVMPAITPVYAAAAFGVMLTLSWFAAVRRWA